MANSYSGGTNVKAGLLLVAASGGLGSTTGAVNVSGGTLDLSSSPQLIGPLTVGSLGTLNLTLTNTLTTSGSQANFGGTLNLLGTTSGTEDLINYGAMGYSGSFANYTGIPSGDKVVYTATQLDLVKAATATSYSMLTTALPLAIHVSSAPTQTSAAILTTIVNTGTTGMDTIDYSGLQAGSSPAGGTLTALAGGSGTGLALGASGTASQNFASATAGSYSLTPLVNSATNSVAGGPAISGGTSGVTVNVFNLASAALTSPATVNLGTVHVFDTATQPVTVQNNGLPGSFTEQLDAGISHTVGIISSGSISLLQAGSSSSALVVGFDTTSGGVKSGTATITLTSDGNGTSNLGTTPLGTTTVTVSGKVFSGNGHWTGGTGTSWGRRTTTNNWIDENGIVAAPGTWGYNDTATFDDTAGANTTVTLDGASPTLSVLTFNTTLGGSYSLQQGSAGTLNLNNGAGAAATVNVLSGTHSISAPMELSSSGSFNMVGNTLLTVSGNISDGGNGSMPLSLTGDNTGTLILGGADNTYSGGTYVDQGTLVANSNGALPDSQALIIGSGGTFVFDPTMTVRGGPAAVGACLVTGGNRAGANHARVVGRGPWGAGDLSPLSFGPEAFGSAVIQSVLFAALRRSQQLLEFLAKLRTADVQGQNPPVLADEDHLREREDAVIRGHRLVGAAGFVAVQEYRPRVPFLFHEFFDRLAIAIDAHAEHFKAPLVIGPVGLQHVRHLLAAGTAPGGEEIHEHDLAPVLLPVQRLAGDRRALEKKRLADEVQPPRRPSIGAAVPATRSSLLAARISPSSR